VDAKVTVSAPGYQTFTLLGTDLSYANFDWTGQLTGGCTDCGGNGNTMGGDVHFSDTSAASTICTTNCPGPIVSITSPTIQVLNPNPEETGVLEGNPTGAVTGIQPSGTVNVPPVVAPPPAVTSTIITTDPNAGTITTQTVTRDDKTGKETAITDTETIHTETNIGGRTFAEETQASGSTAGSGIEPGQNHVIISVLPLGTSAPLPWYRLDLGGQDVYLVNPGVILILLLSAFCLAAVAWPYIGKSSKQK
jgi:hypothetical protein